MAHKLVWGHDLYKGFKLDKNTLLNGAIDDLLPFQMMKLEDKTADWIHAVADYYETAGWQNVERKAHRIQKNFWMRNGDLDMSDYVINPEINTFSQAIGMVTPPESQSPLEQFYHLAPNFVDVLRGEFIKRDNTWTIEAIDPESKAQMFKQKEDQYRQIMMQYAMLEKQQSLAQMGLSEEVDPEQYQQQMQAFQQQLVEVEMKSKSFRTKGIEWADKVIRMHEKRYNLHELEPDAFECGLITDSEYWHLDMLDDDFKLETINPKWADSHKGPSAKYVSDGDYFLWFDWMSAGDIVNKFGRRMKEEDILKMKEVYVKTANIIVPDYLKGQQGAYYDLSKPWAQATNLDPKMNDAMLGKELAYSFMRSPNFDHNIDVDILNPIYGRLKTGHPQMFRIMRLYWRALRRIGWLTRIDRDGTLHEPTWIDENYRVTIEPKYDTSVIKEKSKDNLLYGEHIDWTWANEWRHVIKISPNQKHTFWMNSPETMESIYIDGAPVKFQFKGVGNPFDSLPPVEGCQFNFINSGPKSFIDRIKPMQILYNICMNKVPKKFLADKGNKVAVDTRIINFNNLDVNGGEDPIEAYNEMLDTSDVLPYKLSREAMEGMGQPALPQVLQLSTIQEAQLYFQLGQQIKWEAGELIGISRQRVGGQKASETATSIQQGIAYSETQTEKYFEQHANLMQRVRQRMLDATQFYSTFNETNRDYYMNTQDENVFLEIGGMENTMAQYNIWLQSRANVRGALQKITQYLESDNTLAIPASAKIQAFIDSSLPKVMAAIKDGEARMEQMQSAEQQQAMALEEKKMEAMQMQHQMASELQAQKDQAAFERETTVAEIRALGGVQTDADADGGIDAQQNLDAYLKQQATNKKSEDAQYAANLKRQSDVDKLMVEREKTATKLQETKIKTKGALDVAKENTRKKG